MHNVKIDFKFFHKISVAEQKQNFIEFSIFEKQLQSAI